MKHLYSSLVIHLFIGFALCQSALLAQAVSFKDAPPEILNVEPKEISPGTALKIEGYRLGVNGSPKIIFLQNTREYVTSFGGASWQEADLSRGLQELNVIVPEEISAGKCEVFIDYNGRRSSPVGLDVLATPKPPKLVSVKPQIAMPGEAIWINGVGFNTSDTAELVDAEGKTHHVNLGVTSSAETSSFTLRDDVPDGPVTLKILEKRLAAFKTTVSP